MVEIRTVRSSELEALRRLHNRYTGSNESLTTIREWHRECGDLLVGAYRGEQLVGHCLGHRRIEDEVVLTGIAVRASHRRSGVGSELLVAFENRAASLGFRRVSLGSAGGYVDEFYIENGYSPETILVRLDQDDVPPDYRNWGYEIAEEKIDDGTKKIYVEVEEFDPTFVEEIREAFGDPEAIYIMAKDLDAS